MSLVDKYKKMLLKRIKWAEPGEKIDSDIMNIVYMVDSRRSLGDAISADLVNESIKEFIMNYYRYSCADNEVTITVLNNIRTEIDNEINFARIAGVSVQTIMTNIFNILSRYSEERLIADWTVDLDTNKGAIDVNIVLPNSEEQHALSFALDNHFFIVGGGWL